MNGVFNLCRSLGRYIKTLPWHDSSNPCVVEVVGVLPGKEEGSFEFNRQQVLTSSSVPLSDPSRTYSGVDEDEVSLVVNKKEIDKAREAEVRRCYIGYDTEYQEFRDEDDQKTAKMLSHQLYFAYNGTRKGIVILTELRFTESSFVELLAEAVPNEITTAYLSAHFSLAEGGWLKQSLVEANRHKHLEAFHADPGTYAVARAEGKYVQSLINDVFKIHEAEEEQKRNAARGKTPVAVSQKPKPALPEWLTPQTIRRIIKAGSAKDAYQEFCLKKNNGIQISEDGKNYLWETRQRSPVVPKRDKTWHGSTALLKSSEVDAYQRSAHLTLAEYPESLSPPMQIKDFEEFAAHSVKLRNSGHPTQAEKIWRKLAGRGTDGRRAKMTAAQKAAITKLPKRRLVFVDTVDFGVGSLKKLGETISIPKIELNSGEIDKMEKLCNDDKLRFCEYAFRDAVVSAEGVAWFGRLFRIELGLPLSTRVAGYTAEHFKRLFKEEVYAEKIAKAKEKIDQNLKKYLGWEVRKNRNGGQSWYPSTEMESFSRFYAGGWNAVHKTGSLGPCVYWDLKSAYPCAVLMLSGDYNFSNQRVFRGDAASAEAKRRIDDVSCGGPFQIMGVTVSFKFRDDAEPMFPVRMKESEQPPLSPAESTDMFLYVRSGTANVMWPEFWTAVTMNLLEWWDCSELVTYESLPGESKFANEVYRLLELRGQKGKKVVFKNLLNYLYGKTSQAISKKTVTTVDGTGKQRQKPGSLTCFPIAAYSTSVCRAVMGALLNTNPCYAITTDGFISPVMDFEKLNKGYIAEATQEVLSTLKDYKGTPYQYIEPAYIANESLFVKTRGYALDGVDEDGKPTVKLARMGIQTHAEAPEDEGDDDMRVAEFLKILNCGTFTKSSFPSFAKLKAGGKDLLPLKVESETKISHTFDMKRIPSEPIQEIAFTYGGVSHTQPSFDTVPLESTEQFMRLRRLAVKNLDAAGYVELIKRFHRNEA